MTELNSNVSLKKENPKIPVKIKKSDGSNLLQPLQTQMAVLFTSESTIKAIILLQWIMKPQINRYY